MRAESRLGGQDPHAQQLYCPPKNHSSQECGFMMKKKIRFGNSHLTISVLNSFRVFKPSVCPHFLYTNVIPPARSRDLKSLCEHCLVLTQGEGILFTPC